MDFQQSKTYNNLQTAFTKSLSTSALYSIYSDTAAQETHMNISSIFQITSKNEKEFARIWKRQLAQPTTTLENLRLSSDYYDTAYREYARIALEEGYDNISALFSGIANIELNHSLIFYNLYQKIELGELYCSSTENLWICMQCGNIMNGYCAPTICPVCGFPQGFYKPYPGTIC